MSTVLRSPWLALAGVALLALAGVGAVLSVIPVAGVLTAPRFLGALQLHAAMAAALPVVTLGLLADGVSSRGLRPRLLAVAAWGLGWMVVGRVEPAPFAVDLPAAAWWLGGVALATLPAVFTHEWPHRAAIAAVAVLVVLSGVPGVTDGGDPQARDILYLAAWPVILVALTVRRRTAAYALQLVLLLLVANVFWIGAWAADVPDLDLHLHDTLWTVAVRHASGLLQVLGLLAAASVWRAPWGSLAVQWGLLPPMGMLILVHAAQGGEGMPRRYAARPDPSAADLLPVFAAGAFLVLTLAWMALMALAGGGAKEGEAEEASRR